MSATPHVLESSRALAVLDATHDGRLFGVYAELADGVLARVWVAGATAADARCEPAVPLARDDFLSQLRVPCQGDARDHPGIDAARWPAVLALGTEALAASSTNGRPIAASSSRAVVMHAFGADGRFAALYDLRILEDTSPRRSHRRLALAAARCDGAGTVLHSRLAISDALPTPAMAIF
ncbi:MAG: hypothetical protein IT502_17920 [Rubrivivax sp.]|nr:hypothetical protein [Rubrivivax sp.]